MRRVWPDRYKRSDVYWKIIAADRRWGFSRRIDALRGRAPKEIVVQDVEVPSRHRGVHGFLRARGGDLPGVAVPVAPAGPRPSLDPVRVRSRDDLRQCGLLVAGGTRSGADPRAGAVNRRIEAKVADLGGRKSLYLTSFYTREQFYEIYGGGEYARLKARYDPQGRSAGLYEKTCRRARRSRRRSINWPVRTRTWSSWPMTVQQRAGRLGSDVRLEVKSPKAIAALLGAPGQLGLARAYVTGDLEVTGDPVYSLRPVGAGRGAGDLLAAGEGAVGPAFRALLAAEAAPAAGGGPGQRRPTQPPPRRAGHLAPLRRLQPLLRVGARPDDGLHLRCLPKVRTPPWSRRRSRSSIWCRKLQLEPGMRVLDVGCGWGGFAPACGGQLRRRSDRGHLVRTAGPLGPARRVRGRAPTVSWTSGTATTVRYGESGFDRIASIGLTEHIGKANHPAYFGFLHSKLVDGAGCSTTASPVPTRRSAR